MEGAHREGKVRRTQPVKKIIEDKRPRKLSKIKRTMMPSLAESRRGQKKGEGGRPQYVEKGTGESAKKEHTKKKKKNGEPQ